MESSLRLLMTVFAVSGSMVLVFHQVNKNLCNNFMKKFEYEIRVKHQAKKRVRFAKDMEELSMSDQMNLAREQKVIEKVLGTDDSKHEQKMEDVMPTNRAVLYRGIMNDRKVRIGF